MTHPGVVHVYGRGSEAGVPFLVVQYLDGGGLGDRMNPNEPLDPEAVAEWLPQVSSALDYLHQRGLVHRDIKPENVLLSKEGAVKVADFGLAKLVTASSGPDPTLTRAGQVMGTVHYMAPEQIESPSSVDHRADIFSLGVVFYELLTGELPVGRFPPPSKTSKEPL